MNETLDPPAVIFKVLLLTNLMGNYSKSTHNFSQQIYSQ
jgi:hypothetical protein